MVFLSSETLVKCVWIRVCVCRVSFWSQSYKTIQASTCCSIKPVQKLSSLWRKQLHEIGAGKWWPSLMSCQTVFAVLQIWWDLCLCMHACVCACVCVCAKYVKSLFYVIVLSWWIWIYICTVLWYFHQCELIFGHWFLQADFVRVAHPDRKFSEAAEDTCVKLSSLVEK